jgi:hypothetical protein
LGHAQPKQPLAAAAARASCRQLRVVLGDLVAERLRATACRWV